MQTVITILLFFALAILTYYIVVVYNIYLDVTKTYKDIQVYHRETYKFRNESNNILTCVKEILSQKKADEETC